MNCEQFKKAIYVKPLRERTPTTMRRLNDHAAQCPSCARRLADAAQLERKFAALPHVPPPTNMIHNVMRRAVAAKPAPSPAANRFSAAACWAAGLVGAMSLAIAYLLATSPTGWLERLSLRWVRPFGATREILGPLAAGPTGIALLATAGALLVILGFAARGREAT